ncbi:MAG: DUF1287 domain-containing protein [Hyphomicrobium sp.]
MPPDRIAHTPPHWRRVAAERSAVALARRRKRFAEAEVNTRKLERASAAMGSGPRALQCDLGAAGGFHAVTATRLEQSSANAPPSAAPPRPLFALALFAAVVAGLGAALYGHPPGRPHPALLAFAPRHDATPAPAAASLEKKSEPLQTLRPAASALAVNTPPVREAVIVREQTYAGVAAADPPSKPAAVPVDERSAQTQPISPADAAPPPVASSGEQGSAEQGVRSPPLELVPLSSASAAFDGSAAVHLTGPRVGRCEVDGAMVGETALTDLTPDSADFGRVLATAALRQTGDFVVYTDKYRKMSFPMGDVPALFGVCTDVVIRAYRAVGIDLQALIHSAHIGPRDPSIAHRRTFTLRRYFASRGASLPVTDFVEDFQAGDIVTYDRPQNRGSRDHIAIVTDIVAASGRPMIVHNRGWGPQLEDALFVDRITGHYRYRGRTEPVKFAARDPASEGSGGKDAGKVTGQSGVPSKGTAVKHATGKQSRGVQRRADAVKAALRARGLQRLPPAVQR